MTRRTRLVSSLVVLVIVIGVPVLLTWQAARQARLDRDLITAVKQSKADAVISLLHQGADPNATEHSANSVSTWQMFRSLFLRFHQNRSAQEGKSVLLIALKLYATEDQETMASSNPRLVKALLDAGANVRCRDEDNITPLHLAVLVCPSEVPHLLEKGADVNAEDDGGMTALSLADWKGDEDMISLLKRAGAKE